MSYYFSTDGHESYEKQSLLQFARSIASWSAECGFDEPVIKHLDVMPIGTRVSQDGLIDFQKCVSEFYCFELESIAKDKADYVSLKSSRYM